MLKRSFTIICALLFVGWSSSCSRKTAPAAEADYDGPTISYAADIAPIMKRSCSPCHYPDQGGKKASLHNYGSLKNMIREVVTRVQLPEDDDKFMPFKHKRESLSTEEIEMLKNWAKGNFIE